MHIKKIYQILSAHFGEQGWWHADSLFEICAGIILVQYTTWQNAAKGIENLKRANLLELKKVAHTPLEKLRKLLRPTGFYRQKAEYLRTFSRYCLEKYDGNLKKWFKKPKEELREELLRLKGIGEETADSILLYAAQKPVFVVDLYTKRILERLGIVKKGSSFSEIKAIIEKELPPDLKIYKELRALFVELGKRYCRPKPYCNNCPLESVCQKHI